MMEVMKWKQSQTIFIVQFAVIENAIKNVMQCSQSSFVMAH